MTPAYRVTATGAGPTPHRVRRDAAADSWAVTVAGPADVDPDVLTVVVPGAVAVHAFTSSWGLEFEPVRLPVAEPVTWEVTSGRSSNGAVPWLGVETDTGWVVITLHWSGNWRFAWSGGGDALRVAVGLHPDGQRVVLPAGATLRLPEVSVASGPTRAAASAALVRLLAHQVPAGPPELPTEWNHWWPYEDAEIDEQTFLAEAAAAAELGLDVAVLDAGWFGRSDPGSDWVAERGDWHRVNSARFGHGLGWLADRTRAAGLEFGLWVEAEAVGPAATVAAERPELLARGRDGTALGYVCLGSPAGRRHVHDQVSRLITETGARWVKWDFNLDPGSGCARDDHGHLDRDGLLRHYLGLYAVLDALRAEHPRTLFEACSSGGLRLDAGLAAHVDGFFLSDPDWTEHHLACLWGAAQLLPPRQLLHWPESEWRGEHRFQKVDYSGSLLTTERFDTKIRAAMLHRFGLSVRLTRLRPDLAVRLRHHLRVYADAVRPLLAAGVLVPLTDQPLREERGHRQPAYRLSSGEDHLVAAFRLHPTGDWQPGLPLGLDRDLSYEVTDLDHPDGRRRSTGAELLVAGLRPEPTATSAWWSLRAVR